MKSSSCDAYPSSWPIPRRRCYLTKPPPTPTYTLSLHDALPISVPRRTLGDRCRGVRCRTGPDSETARDRGWPLRSEEHTSELQSRLHLVCRLLLEKKKAGEAAGVPHEPVSARIRRAMRVA